MQSSLDEKHQMWASPSLINGSLVFHLEEDEEEATAISNPPGVVGHEKGVAIPFEEVMRVIYLLNK
ncbi:hypothetical protein I3843_15G018100 [Carya illinoinensis]|nr:hypothetical protein I3843_15G018100 [Carya illinoinensis]